MSREIWRDVPTWEGFYQASSHGRLRRVGRRALKLNMSKRGYLRVNFTDRGRRQMVLVHHAVAAAFKKAPRAGRLVRHHDGDTKSNRPGNLRYGTQKHNMEDCIRHGNSCRGERHGAAKLTSRQVIAIRSSSESQKALADRYGVGVWTIGRLQRFESWAWL